MPDDRTVASVATTTTAAQTEALGARLAARLRPGDVVLVAGEMGTGKTTLVRGACRALGVREPVTSPTFTLGRRYQGSVPVSHLDLYRLEAPDQEDPALLADYLTADAVTFVEWPQRGAELTSGLPAGVVARVELEHCGGDARRITVS